MPDTATDIQVIRASLAYDPASGVLTRKIATKTAQIGSIAGGVRGNGYRYVSVGGRVYLEHRVAFLLYHGRWPVHEVDHIDRNPLNNAISNLREASPHENTGNVGIISTNTSGYRGVSFRKDRGKWSSYIWHGNKKRTIGTFLTADAAARAYDVEAAKHFGKYAFLNFPETRVA